MEAIDVRYERAAGVVDADDAIAPGAPLVWPAATGNIAAEVRHGDAAATAAAFAKAAHVVALDLVNQRVAPCPIEPRAICASYDAATERITLRVSSQTPTGLRDTLCAEVLGIPQRQGARAGRRCRRRLRHEDRPLSGRRRARVLRARIRRGRSSGVPSAWRNSSRRRMAAMCAARPNWRSTRTGAFSRCASRRCANVGAYATPAGVVIQLLIGPWVSTSIYDIGTIDIRIKAVLTHTTPTSAYRGAGRPEAIYIIERLMDAAARQTGIDRVEAAPPQHDPPEQMPYTNPMDKTYDSGKFASVMDQATALADWNGFDARARKRAARGRLRGRGMATFLEWTGVDIFTERVTVTVAGDGEIEIFSATQAMGQGLATTYAQLAVDVFGVPIEKIRIVQGDTDRGTGFGSAGSRSLFVGGSAVRVASERTVEEAQELAASELEAAVGDIEYRDGVFRIGGTDRSIGLFELARRQPQRAHRARLDELASPARHGPTAATSAKSRSIRTPARSRSPRYWSVNDVGRVVNPMIVVGQLEGGAVQGIGQALCEDFVYDRETGQALTASFQDYALPRADMIRHFEMTMDESTPCLNNAMGVKGVGELGTIGATPAVVNAVLDALRPRGRAHRRWRCRCR